MAYSRHHSRLHAGSCRHRQPPLGPHQRHRQAVTAARARRAAAAVDVGVRAGGHLVVHHRGHAPDVQAWGWRRVGSPGEHTVRAGAASDQAARMQALPTPGLDRTRCSCCGQALVGSPWANKNPSLANPCCLCNATVTAQTQEEKGQARHSPRAATSVATSTPLSLALKRSRAWPLRIGERCAVCGA